MHLFKFEIKKSWRQKKYLILSILIVAFVSLVFYRNVLLQDAMVENEHMKLYPHFRESSDLLTQMYIDMNGDTEKESLKMIYENGVELNQAIRDLQSTINSKDWDSYPMMEAVFLQGVTKHLELGGQYNAFQGDELEQRIAKNKILLKHELPYEDEKYALSVPIFMKSAAGLLLSFFGVFFFVLLLADTLSDEFEHYTIRTLYTQPLKKFNILLIKYASMMTSVIFALFVFSIACVLIPLILGESWGSFSYPQLVVLPDGFSFISISEYLSKLAILFIGTASFSFSLTLFISILIRNRFSSILVVIFILSGGIFITNQLETLQTVFNPFYYFRFTEIIEKPYVLGSIFYVMVIFIYSFIILYFSHLVQVKGLFFQRESTIKRPFQKGETLQAHNTLIAIFLFEARKIWRQSSFKHSILLLLILLVAVYLLLTHETNKREQDFFTEMKWMTENYDNDILPSLNKIIEKNQSIIEELSRKNSPLNEKEKSQLEIAEDGLTAYDESIEMFRYNSTQTKNVLNAYIKKDWSTYYNYWIEQNRIKKGEIIQFSTPHVDNLPTEKGGLSNFTYNASITEKEILKEKQIEPVLSSEFVYTYHDRFLNSMDQMEWRRETQKVDNTGLMYLYTFFQSYIYLFFSVLLIFLFGTGFAVEKGKIRTLDFLRTQPISSFKLLIGKFSSSSTYTIGTTLGLLVLMVLIGIVGNRFGDWDYPVLYYEVNNNSEIIEESFHFINMGTYLLETTLLFLASLIFLLILSIFLSLFFTNTISSVSTTFIIAIVGYFVSSFPQMSFISHVSPFTYLSIGKIANGEMAAVLNNYFIQPWIGIIILLLSTIILLVCSFIWLQKPVIKRDKQK